MAYIVGYYRKATDKETVWPLLGNTRLIHIDANNIQGTHNHIVNYGNKKERSLSRILFFAAFGTSLRLKVVRPRLSIFIFW